MLIRQWAVRLGIAAFVLGLVVTGVGFNTDAAKASDHDDGETNIKSRNASLTDLFVFREDWQTGNAADNGNLIFIMCTNPRSLPRQNYYFNTDALYNFHLSRATNVNEAVSGREDLRFEFSFGAPNNNSQQSIQLNVHQVTNGVPSSTATGQANNPLTTAAPARLTSAPIAPVVNTFNVNGTNINVFAGLREDPFFFDVTQYFRIRAFLRGSTAPTDQPQGGGTEVNTAFNPAQFATDFAQDYNVNAIVMRVPIAFLQSNGQTTFDVWESITRPGNVTQFQ